MLLLLPDKNEINDIEKTSREKLQLAAAMILSALVFSAIMLSEGFRFAPVELDFGFLLLLS